MGYIIRVYKIVNNVDDRVYIGSTKETLTRRFQGHKAHYRQHLKQEATKEETKTKSKYTSSFILFREFGIENCDIILIKEIEVENKEQQNKCEREIQDEFKAHAVNQVRPYITEEERDEYKKVNSERASEAKKQKRQQIKMTKKNKTCGFLVMVNKNKKTCNIIVKYMIYILALMPLLSECQLKKVFRKEIKIYKNRCFEPFIPTINYLRELLRRAKYNRTNIL